MSETLSKKGSAITTTSKQAATVQDAAGNNWSFGTITNKGAQLNLNGSNSNFPNPAGAGYMVSQAFYGPDGMFYAEGYSGGWKKYVGSTWVATNNPRDM